MLCDKITEKSLNLACSKDMTISKSKFITCNQKGSYIFFCKKIACSKDRTICKGTVAQNEKKNITLEIFLRAENALHEK